MKLLLGDSLEKLKELSDNSVDAVVTDPPYGLAFMGKKWDYEVPTKELWFAVFRVLKPGGHMLIFGGTRTYHRLACAIEDAGFEIRDQIQWIYGSGFPKSLDVSKAIDKAAGAQREVIGCKGTSPDIRGNSYDGQVTSLRERLPNYETAPATDLAKQWDGWGTALKPANEPIVLARKPLEKGLTIAENVVKWGTGAINVDASRIGTEMIERGRAGRSDTCGKNGIYHDKLHAVGFEPAQGRWPANVLFDEAAAESLGEPSRFFYVAKASKRERNAGLEGLEAKFTRTMNGGIGGREHNPDEPTAYNQNFHPTVKPIKLMEYLCKLITPPGGTILDPFMGSGSTGVAAKNLGFNFIGIEREQEYLEIARRRIEHVEASA